MTLRFPGSLCASSCIILVLSSSAAAKDRRNVPPEVSNARISLNRIVIGIEPSEPSYVQHGSQDLARYLGEITGSETPVTNSLNSQTPSAIIIGKMAEKVLPGVVTAKALGDQGYTIKSFTQDGKCRLIVAGANPHGTNSGIAALMRMIRAEGKLAYVDGPLDVRSTPTFPIRGIHLNGWSFNYPYAYRPWNEQDWERFIDILWVQGGNLLYVLPMIEIMPVPLSAEDQASLQEVHRIVDYAHKRRGIAVWMMTSVNRVAVSDCGERNPKLRPFWVNQCQVDMNPADPQQFDKIMQSREALYRALDNADGFGMIDSDPGGWPQSPIRDQIRVFKASCALLDRYNQKGARADLIDWMWVGWGRHKFASSTKTVVGQYDWTEKNPDASDVAFMQDTIQAFRNNLPEPWSLIAGFPAYLASAQREHELGKTVFLPYGAIEYEPSFPMTNVGLDSVRNSLEVLNQYPGTGGLMGNNMTPLLQLPRTFLFLSSAWDFEYRKTNPRDVLRDLARRLYPEHEELVADGFAALDEDDPAKIDAVLRPLESLVRQEQLGRPGVIGRKLFPDPLQVARDLVFELKIRAARQNLLQALLLTPDRSECVRLVRDYLEALLAWDKRTGWDRLISLGIWRSPIYASDKHFTEALSNLKRVLASGSAVTSYAAVSSFFDPIAQELAPRYGEDAVMIGCIEPLKLAVIQAP